MFVIQGVLMAPDERANIYWEDPFFIDILSNKTEPRLTPLLHRTTLNAFVTQFVMRRMGACRKKILL